MHPKKSVSCDLKKLNCEHCYALACRDRGNNSDFYLGLELLKLVHNGMSICLHKGYKPAERNFLRCS